MTRSTDADLVARCRTGDEAAWELLIERYTPLILSIPRRYGMRAAHADDVFAEVCLALVKNLGKIRDPQSLPLWIIRTATRATWDVNKKAKTTPPEDLPPLTGAAPPDEFAAALEEEHLVREALAEISERCRRLLDLLYFAAPTPSYDDVALKMGMPRGSLGPTRRRCLDQMRARLEPHVSETRGSPPKG